MIPERVPILDLRDLDRIPQQFIADLGHAYETIGFCCFVGHGLDRQLLADAYRVFADFFALPAQTKMRYHLANGAGTRGYTPVRVETARTSTIADLKEFWHIGREGEVPERYRPIMRPNLWPQELPEFRLKGLALYNALERLGDRLLRAMAVDLGQEADFFVEKMRYGNSILRALHYPPVNVEDLPAVRAQAHEDISLITLLVGATDAGLEVQTRDGNWLAVDAGEDAVIVNVGDMMQRLTNHRYRSTTHRVVNPTGPAAARSRYSVPFFMDPNPDFLIQSLPGCVDASHPDLYPEPITADAYLMERLAEIKLTPMNTATCLNKDVPEQRRA